MMLTRRARRSGVDQAVVRVADLPAEQEGLLREVPAGRPPASHGRSMSCDSLWSWRDPRDVLNGILWILRTGAP